MVDPHFPITSLPSEGEGKRANKKDEIKERKNEAVRALNMMVMCKLSLQVSCTDTIPCFSGQKDRDEEIYDSPDITTTAASTCTTRGFWNI